MTLASKAVFASGQAVFVEVAEVAVDVMVAGAGVDDAVAVNVGVTTTTFKMVAVGLTSVFVEVGVAVFVTAAFVGVRVAVTFFVGGTVPVRVTVKVRDGVADTVPVPGVGVKVAVFVAVLVKVGVSVGVLVGVLVLVAVAESASACAVCATMVGSWFTSNVGMAGGGVTSVVTEQASETIKINAHKRMNFFMNKPFVFIINLPIFLTP